MSPQIWGTDAWVDIWAGFRYPLHPPSTLPARVQTLFNGGGPYDFRQPVLDFPSITEVCELAEQRPFEIAEAVHLLAQALREDGK